MMAIIYLILGICVNEVKLFILGCLQKAPP
jgi:hypothetical protein